MAQIGESGCDNCTDRGYWINMIVWGMKTNLAFVAFWPDFYYYFHGDFWHSKNVDVYSFWGEGVWENVWFVHSWKWWHLWDGPLYTLNGSNIIILRWNVLYLKHWWLNPQTCHWNSIHNMDTRMQLCMKIFALLPILVFMFPYLCSHANTIKYSGNRIVQSQPKYFSRTRTSGYKTSHFTVYLHIFKAWSYL